MFAAALFPLYRPQADGASRVRDGSRAATHKGRTLRANKQTTMSYIESFETELADKLESGTEDTASIVRWVSEKVLESYRNGITAGQKGAQVIRKGQGRRSGFARQAEFSREA